MLVAAGLEQHVEAALVGAKRPQSVGLLDHMDDLIGAHPARAAQRLRHHVGDDDQRCAGAARGHHHQRADRAAAGDEH